MKKEKQAISCNLLLFLMIMLFVFVTFEICKVSLAVNDLLIVNLFLISFSVLRETKRNGNFVERNN